MQYREKHQKLRFFKNLEEPLEMVCSVPPQYFYYEKEEWKELYRDTRRAHATTLLLRHTAPVLPFSHASNPSHWSPRCLPIRLLFNCFFKKNTYSLKLFVERFL